jgi:ribonuclease HI
MRKDALKIYSDGGARGNPGPAAAAFVAIEDGKVIHKEKKYLGKKTNNEAEYVGVLMGLRWLSENQKDYIKYDVIYNLDSELVTKQINGQYKIKSPNLKPLIIKVRQLINSIDNKILFKSLPRSNNSLADSLVNQALDKNS